ncbi:hypothetical protein AwDysgo_21650 [Bacteroidales bacterium]|nr:hypothetical protein AwDysgo_21650 [Bacteroidales bacterium]
MMRKFFLGSLTIIVGLLISSNMKAQVRIGGENLPTRGATLDLSSTAAQGYKGGLLIPRIEIHDLRYIPESFTDFETFEQADRDTVPSLTGTVVYNTHADEYKYINVGFHYWNGNSWIPISNNWELTGNNLMDPSSFIGTKKHQPLILGTNSRHVVRIDPTSGRVGIGDGRYASTKLDVDSSILVNGIPIGMGANRDFSADNIAFGKYALKGSGDPTGVANIAFGTNALTQLNYGSRNVALGNHTQMHNVNAINNNAVGDSALSGNIDGYYNSALGSLSLSTSKTGNDNVAVGFLAGAGIVSGRNNIVIGRNSSVSTSITSYELNIETAIRAFNKGYNIALGNFTNLHPTHRLAVNGDIMAQEIHLTSDKRFKKNIEAIPGALNKLLKLQGVSYDWRTDEFEDRQFNNQHQLGLIAQDVEKIVPEAISISADGYYSIDYNKIIPILIEAVKEQEKIRKSKDQEVLDIQQRLAKLEAALN